MEELKKLILELVPLDGSTIGNQNLLGAIRARLPDVEDSDYFAARDALIDAGELDKGRGRGGSVYRVDASTKAAEQTERTPDNAEDEIENDESGEEEDEDDDGFALTIQDAPTARVQVANAKTKRRAKASGPVQVLSYRHPDKRMNNPEVGMVHPENDPDQPKSQWAFDPHIDPALQFDASRSMIEQLIDGAIASKQSDRDLTAALNRLVDEAILAGKVDKDVFVALVQRAIEADRSVHNTDRMRDALIELKQLQKPYLNWAGKAERTSFKVDTVSLHVHERIDPASIISSVRKRLKGEKDGGEQAFQPGLFDAPFENLPLRQALDFYKYEKNWSNRLIAGDSLLVMNSLLHKESMAGQVQMIYIDPPDLLPNLPSFISRVCSVYAPRWGVLRTRLV